MKILEKVLCRKKSSPEVRRTIEEFYKALNFPSVHDKEFYKALDEVRISPKTNVKSYDVDSTDGRRSLLSYLYMCKALRERYAERGIPEEILYKTLSDLVIWTNTWTDLKGGLYLGELWWLSLHLDMQLFRLGRLQFGFGKCLYDLPQYKLKKDDPVIDVHIPEGEPLTPEECDKSFAEAREFFKKYFPEFKYEYFTCHSWLLDDTLDELLPETSNVIKFKARFDRVHTEKENMLLRYIFKWNVNETNLRHAYPISDFAAEVKRRVLSGKDFNITYGILK